MSSSHSVGVSLDVLLVARAIPSAPSGTSPVITEPAPVYARSPTPTGATNEVWTPVFTSFPMLRPVLLAAVVVRGDRAGAEVGPLADVGVPDVGQVGHLRARADVRVLDFDEGADLRSLADDRARPQVGEGPHRGVAADPALGSVGVHDGGAVADARVERRSPAGRSGSRRRPAVPPFRLTPGRSSCPRRSRHPASTLAVAGGRRSRRSRASSRRASAPARSPPPP